MNRKETLDAAATCILQDRNNVYGSPEDSFTLIANFWGLILGTPVTPVQVALCLDAVKTARLVTNPKHTDSWVDKAGYAACGAEIATRPKAPLQVMVGGPG